MGFSIRHSGFRNIQMTGVQCQFNLNAFALPFSCLCIDTGDRLP